MDTRFCRSVALGVTALACAANSASATLINFDSLAAYVLVTTQYAGVTFSSDPGEGFRCHRVTPRMECGRIAESVGAIIPRDR